MRTRLRGALHVDSIPRLYGVCGLKYYAAAFRAALPYPDLMGFPLYVAPIPRCPEHGQMKPRSGGAGNGYTGTTWACPGWDGEGCDHTASQEWVHIGHADRIDIDWGR